MRIQEFLPNPVGNDKAGEYITLYNDGKERVDLTGWKIKDESQKAYTLSGFLDPNSTRKFEYEKTKISLNNNGETIFLYDPTGVLVDKLSYTGSAQEGQLIQREVVLTEATKKELFDPLALAESIDTVPEKASLNWLLFIILAAAVALTAMIAVRFFHNAEYIED